MLPVSLSWLDIGGWDTVWDVSPRDERGNAVHGSVHLHDVRNSLIRSDGPLTAVVGLDNVVVVTTPDAVLVTARERSAAVKDVVAALSTPGRRAVDEHPRTYRSWGWIQRIDGGPYCQVSRIALMPGQSLPIRKNLPRAEHWIIASGRAEVTVGETRSRLAEHEAVYIPAAAAHRWTNAGSVPLELIAVQLGSDAGEDDTLRFAEPC